MSLKIVNVTRDKMILFGKINYLTLLFIYNNSYLLKINGALNCILPRIQDNENIKKYKVFLEQNKNVEKYKNLIVTIKNNNDKNVIITFNSKAFNNKLALEVLKKILNDNKEYAKSDIKGFNVKYSNNELILVLDLENSLFKSSTNYGWRDISLFIINAFEVINEIF